MAEKSSLKIISEKWVKPSSPTPPSSKYYKLSIFDAHAPSYLICFGFFYAKGTQSLDSVSLETSLSKTLENYYPFAGRIMNDKITVDCNDEGVKFWEVEIQVTMSEILNNHLDYHSWESVFIPEMNYFGPCLVRVQLSYFACGGIFVGICLSHRLGDAITMANFICDWSIITRCGQNSNFQPIFSAGSIFPPPPNFIPNEEKEISSITTNYVTQRFVFSASNISKLKERIAKETQIKNPTQSEVITAIIFKSIMSSSSSAKINYSLMHIVNFRRLIIPPLSEHHVGNLVTRFMITFSAKEEEEDERSLSRIVNELRNSKDECVEGIKGRLEGYEFHLKLKKYTTEMEKKYSDGFDNYEVYKFSSCFRIPFYEVDFGFGKPLFVSAGGLSEEAIILTGNSRGDGIEAFVRLKEDQMLRLESNEELLAFASLNPNICELN